jgi:hypothetical protein
MLKSGGLLMFDGNGGNNKNADPMKMVFRLIASLQKI